VNDDDVRTLLDDAVSGVEPRPGLDAIRARTAVRPRRGQWWVVGVAVAATLAVVTGVSVLGQHRPGGAGGPVAASPSGVPTPGSEQTLFPVYFLGDAGGGHRLFRDWQVSGGPPRTALLQRAISGTSNDPDYWSLWPAGTTVRSVHVDEDHPGSAAVVDLTGTSLADRPAGMSGDDAVLSVQQLLWTLDAVLPADTPVDVRLDGAPTSTLLGVDVGRLTRQSADQVMAPVQVDEPIDGATVGRTFTVRGRAAAFEANVQWELKLGDAVVKRGFTTAEECCTLSPYEFKVEDVQPGDYTLVVHDEDASDGEGTGPSQDTKRVTVTE
jgi:hypothetical protein